MRIYRWMGVGLLCAATGMVQAQSYYPQARQYRAPAQAPVQAPGPAMVLRHGLNKLMAFVAQDEPPASGEMMLFLEKEISPYFDFEYMAQWVGGGNWQRMSPQQQQQMSAQLQQMFLTALSQKLSKFGGQGFKVLRARPGQGGEVTVPVAVQNPGGYPSRLNFRFYRSQSGGWRVFDVSANGSSALVYYRQHFNRTGYPSRQGRPIQRRY